jgi:putative glutamine amidotransferase
MIDTVTNSLPNSKTDSLPKIKMGTIACHEGTGTGIVADILANWDYDLVQVKTQPMAGRIHFDGLILLGGADINPFFYGEGNLYCDHTDRQRDLIEWTLVRRALAMHVPILGICRGHQMLTVACGGSLYQDIYTQTGRGHHSMTHTLTSIRNPLKRVLPTDTVNSLHHQAVKSIPPGFDMAALSSDGIIEAIWRPGMLGVQWHPELLYMRDHAWERIFRWFVDGLQ